MSSAKVDRAAEIGSLAGRRFCTLLWRGFLFSGGICVVSQGLLAILLAMHGATLGEIGVAILTVGYSDLQFGFGDTVGQVVSSLFVIGALSTWGVLISLLLLGVVHAARLGARST